MVDLLAKLDPATRGQAESIVRQAMQAGFTKEHQHDLFGAFDQVSSLFLPRARALEGAQRALGRSRRVHSTAAGAADTLEATGSRIARAASEQEAEASARTIAYLDKLAHRPGPVGDDLDAAARQLAGGERLADVVKRLVGRLRTRDLAELAGDGARDRDLADGDGRAGGAVGEDGGVPKDADGLARRLADETDAVPGATAPPEIEGGTISLFDEPAGPAAQRQAVIVAHDAAMDAAMPIGIQALPDIVSGQRGRALEDLHAVAVRNQAELNDVGAAIADETGTSFKPAKPKDIGRAREKLANEGYGDAGELKDLARASFKVETPEQGQAIVDALARRYALHDKGWKRLESTGYLDRKLIVRMVDGGVAEVQIVPASIWDYKFGEGHRLYEQSRTAEIDQSRKTAIEAQQAERYVTLLADTPFARLSSAGRSASGNALANSERSIRYPSNDALPTSPGASPQRPPDQAQANPLDPSADQARPTARSSTSNNSSDGMDAPSATNIGDDGLGSKSEPMPTDPTYRAHVERAPPDLRDSVRRHWLELEAAERRSMADRNDAIAALPDRLRSAVSDGRADALWDTAGATDTLRTLAATSSGRRYIWSADAKRTFTYNLGREGGAGRELEQVDDPDGSIFASRLGAARQPEFRLDVEGETRSPQDILGDIDADAKAAAAMRGCLIPPKGDA